MKEVIAEVMTAGALLLSPHPTEQPAIAAPVSHEIVVDNQASPSAQIARPENAGLAAIDSIPIDMAISESLDPDTIRLYLELGGGSVGLILTGFTTSLRLKRSLRRNHRDITERGWEAQAQLSGVLTEARQQAAGLKEDDVPELRRLIVEYDPVSDRLLGALASTDPEFNTERDRLFPLKRRLGRAPNTKLIIQTTKPATKKAQELQTELERVRTDLLEIDDNIDLAASTLASLFDDLAALTQKGWDISTYERRAVALAEALEAAREKRAENYIDEPVKITKMTTTDALKLSGEASVLEPRRIAADQAHGTQPGRITAAQATAETVRGRFAELQDMYSAACVVGFENLPDGLTQTITILISAHETGSSLTGRQGMGVEAVARSEELNASFDEAIEQIRVMEGDLQEREDHLSRLALQLPREVRKLSARFDRAFELADDPDVEGETADEIRALNDDVASLSANVSTAEGQKPDYLILEERHQNLAAEVDQAHRAATAQKQEMNDLRANIPELTDGYNNLVTAIKNFSGGPKVRLQTETWNSIRKLQPYKIEMASDRQNLRAQQRHLKKILRGAHSLMEQVEGEASEDSPLLAAAKIAGAIALAALIGDSLN